MKAVVCHAPGDVRVEEEAIHETSDGRKLLVIHGDQFDGIVRYARWLHSVLRGEFGTYQPAR